ncbi:MAG: hypothetical protein Q9195_004750 [Heterodermia aff. obscurata]
MACFGVRSFRNVESNKLTKAWTLLRDKLPSDQQVRFAERPQEIGDVFSLASMNYEKIAEGLSRALKEIGEAVDACVKDCVVYPTQAMQNNIANLYAHIFSFLRNTIDWYMKKSVKRALSSLREDFYEKFEEEVSNIKRISLVISREAQHGSHSEIRYTRMLTEDNVIGLQDLKRDLAERKYREEKAANESARERQAALVLESEKMKRLDDLHRLIGESAKALLSERASAFVSEGTKARGTQSSDALNN